MIVELWEEITPGDATMYSVRAGGSTIKWFAHKDNAEKFYEQIVANPDLLKPRKNILKSQEINLSLEDTIN
jgi:hypothetical protein